LRAARFLGLLLSALATLAGAVYFAATGIPSLQGPIKVLDYVALPDGGSIHLVLKDAGGRQLGIGVVGTLDKEQKDFPLYTQRWWPYFPLPALVLKGSTEERELRASVNRWLTQDTLQSWERMGLEHLNSYLDVRQPQVSR
jgi:hypothetical protein